MKIVCCLGVTRNSILLLLVSVESRIQVCAFPIMLNLEPSGFFKLGLSYLESFSMVKPLLLDSASSTIEYLELVSNVIIASACFVDSFGLTRRVCLPLTEIVSSSSFSRLLRLSSRLFLGLLSLSLDLGFLSNELESESDSLA